MQRATLANAPDMYWYDVGNITEIDANPELYSAVSPYTTNALVVHPALHIEGAANPVNNRDKLAVCCGA